MSPDQKTRLERQRQTLYEVLAEELETPLPTLKTAQGRGDRVWLKKNAIVTANLIMRIEDLLGLRGAGAWANRKPAEDPEDPLEGGDGEAAAAVAGEGAEKLIAEAQAKVERKLRVVPKKS